MTLSLLEVSLIRAATRVLEPPKSFVLIVYEVTKVKEVAFLVEELSIPVSDSRLDWTSLPTCGLFQSYRFCPALLLFVLLEHLAPVDRSILVSQLVYILKSWVNYLPLLDVAAPLHIPDCLNRSHPGLKLSSRPLFSSLTFRCFKGDRTSFCCVRVGTHGESST